MVSIKILVIALCLVGVYSEENNRFYPAFDPNIYEDALDPELCSKQLEYIFNSDPRLLMTFLDAGPRLPKGITQGNFVDLGNYHQCLGIHEEVPMHDMVIEGKYCQIRAGLPDLQVLDNNLPGRLFNDVEEMNLLEQVQSDAESFDRMKNSFDVRPPRESRSGMSFGVSICLPKPCSVKQALPELSNISIKFEEQFCRFKDDKPWAPGVYVAIVVFSCLGFLTILSTSYDICMTFISKGDPKSVNKLLQSFSVYTNTRRLVTFTPVRGALECVDGIRTISMAWVVLGHTFTTLPPITNGLDAFQWVLTIHSNWLTAAPIAVDTFFMISGLLLVYTTVGKLSNIKLMKNIHLFYLNRILRMFPLLAATILLQVGVLHYISDGPIWASVVRQTESCRLNWWATLLYIQNYYGDSVCLGHTWYLAIDMQLHILSPLILFWVLSGKRISAWVSLTCGLLISLTASTIYIFLNNFTASTLRPGLTPEETSTYMTYYYINTLTRCSPFFVGMCYGYLIHYWREKNTKMSKMQNLVMWIITLVVLLCAFYMIAPLKKADFDNQTVENLVNSFMRPLWALGLGWLILACAEGYGGPINWLLSLHVWKLPSRLSYAIYLLHFPMQFVINGSATRHFYFSIINGFYVYFSQLVLVFIVSFVFTVTIDSPFSTIIKVLLGGGIKKPNNADEVKNGKLTANK